MNTSNHSLTGARATGVREFAARAHQRGVSLMEVLIGLAIGLVCALAVFQTLAVWNSQTRTTSSGSDAQIAGTLAMYYLDRDFKLAGMGFGMAPTELAGCEISTTDTAFTPAPQMTAVWIQKGATGGHPDLLRVLYGNSAFMVVGQPFDASTVGSKQTRARAGFNVGDRFIAAGSNSTGTTFCRLLEMTKIATPDDSKTILHEDSMAYVLDGIPHVTAPTNNTSSWTGTNFTGRLFNLGPNPVLAEWSVPENTNVLTRANRFAISAPTGLIPVGTEIQRNEIAQGIANLKAQYGYDANANDRIEDTEWVDTLPTPADWTRVRAIRLGLLVRSQQYEQAAVYGGVGSPPTPAWAAGDFMMTDVNGVTDTSPTNANNWRHYRYRVYESMVPLRNMIWGNTAPIS